MRFFISTGLAIWLASALVNAGTTCTVSTSGDHSSNIEAAFSKCKNGGTVVFPSGTTFNMKSVVSVTGLKDVTVQFDSTVNLPSYDIKFTKEKAFFYIEGDNIHWSGSGAFYGNGQGWYNAQNRKAPPLFKPKATNSYFGGFSISQAPRAHFSINGCKNVVFEKLNLHAKSDNAKYDAHNTDAFDVSASSNVTIRSSTIVNGDDCIAVNDGVTDLLVTDLKCTGSHGFSVGSLGKHGSSKTESVSGLRFISNSCIGCQNGVRIKTWPGGKGTVKDVALEDIYLENAENPILITTHYCDNNQMKYCNGQDSHSLSISDVTISGISGTAADNKKNPILYVNCATDTPCTDFTIKDITVKAGSKTTANVCKNLQGSSKISYCN